MQRTYPNGVRSAARPQPKCPSGRTLQKSRKERLPSLQPGPCSGCGVAVHAAMHNCPCSFMRAGLRVCRRCAIGFDYATHGWSKIEGAPFNQPQIEMMRELFLRGVKIAQVGALEIGALTSR